MKIGIIGDGGWGTAIGMLLDGYGHNVTIWGPFEDYINQVRERGENFNYLAGVKFSANVNWTADCEEAVKDAGIIVLASPSKFYRGVCEKFAGLIPSTTPIVSLTKGFCEKTHLRMSEIAKEVLGNRNVVVLSGPSHAEEVARKVPTAVVAASANEILAAMVQRLFSGPRFRVYTSSDALGVEIGGAVKNVIAISVGASDGLGFGDNTRAALITRGLSEMTKLGIAMGAQAETFCGLSGMGDLIVTCTSEHSRNHFVGRHLGQGESIDSILSKMKMVAEGVWNARIIQSLASEYGTEMPICDTVYRLCYENAKAAEEVAALMSRDMKSEK